MLFENVSWKMESYFTRTSILETEPDISELIAILMEYSDYSERFKEKEKNTKYFIVSCGEEKITLVSILKLVCNKFLEIGYTNEEMMVVYQMLEKFCIMAMKGENISKGNIHLERFYELVGYSFSKLARDAKKESKRPGIENHVIAEMKAINKRYAESIDSTAKLVYEFVVS